MKKFKLMQKLIIVAFMVIILTAFAIIATSAATYSGNCGAEGNGSNLTWTLDTGTGVLKISGTGDMADCSSIDSPWDSYRSYIKSINISNSVTSIGYDAFRDCTSLKSVTIPDSVTSIGSYAFMDCGSLTSVTIPDSVTSIGDFAFRNCDSLTSIVVSSNNTAYCSIDGNLYTEDASVLIQYAIGKPDTSFIIPDSVTSIGDYAFDDCDNLKSVTIPDSVTSIGWRPFLGCGSLEYNVYDNAKYLGNEQNPYLYLAYSINDNITSCNIHDDTRLIGNSAFFGCNSLTSVTIPDSVTSIGYEAFAYCSKLTSVTVLSRNAEIAEIYDGMYTFPSSATIYGYAGSTAEAYAEKYDREFVALKNTVGGKGGIDGDNLTWELDLDSGELVISGTGDMINLDCTPWDYKNDIVSVVITDGVTSINSWTFSECDNLTSVTIPDSVTSIGDCAFYDCSSLTSVTIGNSVTTIGECAFYSCDSLKRVYITDIAAWCNISFEDSYANPLCGANLYLNGNLLTDIIIPNGVTGIRHYAFAYCYSLKSITIPDSVTWIGNEAFYACKGLTSVTIGNGLTWIGNEAFSVCNSLTSITIRSNPPTNAEPEIYDSEDTFPSSATIYGYAGSFVHAYAQRYDRKFVVIGGNCGIDGDNLTWEIDLDSGELIISGTGKMANWSSGKSPWYSCRSYIKSVTIPDSVTSIGNYAFSDCTSLTSVTIPDSVTTIGVCAFYYCSKLTSVTIGNSVTSIGSSAFSYCTSLTSVTVLSKNTEIFDSANTFPSSATIYGYKGSTAEAYAEKYGREFVALHCVHDWRYSGTNSECAICKEICADHTELGLDFKCAVCGKDTGATNSFNQGSSMINDTYFTLEKHHNVKVSFDFTIGNAYYDNSTKPSVISDYHSLFTLIRNKNSGGAEYHVFASLWMDQESGKLYLTKAGSSATKICEIELGEKYSFSVNFKPKSSGAHTVTISKGGVVIGTLNANISSFSEDIKAVQLRFGEGVDVKYLRVKDVSYENIEVTPEPYSNGVCTECGAECKHVYNAGGYCHICGMLGDPITFSDGQNGGGNIVDTVKNANPLTIRDGAYSQNDGSYKQCWDFRDTEGLLLGNDYVFEGKFTFNEFIDNPNSENGATNLLIWSDSDIGSDYNKFLVMLYTDNGKLELGISTTQRTELKLGEEYDIRVVIRSDKRTDNKYNNRAEIYVNGRFMWTKNFVLTAEDGMSIRIGDHVVRKSKVKYDVKNDFGIHFIDSGIDYIGLQEKEDANYNYDTKFDLRFVFGFDDLYLEDVGVKIKAESFGGILYDESSSVKSLSSSRTVLEELLVDGKVCKPGINGVGYGGYYLALVVKDIALDPAATYVFTLTPYLKHHDDDNQTLMEKSHKITVIFVDNQMQIDYQEVTK